MTIKRVMNNLKINQEHGYSEYIIKELGIGLDEYHPLRHGTKFLSFKDILMYIQYKDVDLIFNFDLDDILTREHFLTAYCVTEDDIKKNNIRNKYKRIFEKELVIDNED